MDKSKKATRKANIEGAVRFPALRIAVKDSEVVEMKTLGDIIRHLGPLAGASAEVTRGTVAGPHNLAKAFAFVKFADGTLLERKLTGAWVRHAEAECVRFNHLAAVTRSAETEES